MASIRKVDYYSARVPNRAGMGAKVLGAMKSAGVNLLAFTGFPEKGGAQVDFVPQNGARFRAAAKKAGIKHSAKKTAFLAQGNDRVGALTTVAAKLAEAKVSLVALQAVTAGKGRYGAIFWVKRKDVARVKRVLKAR